MQTRATKRGLPGASALAIGLLGLAGLMAACGGSEPVETPAEVEEAPPTEPLPPAEEAAAAPTEAEPAPTPEYDFLADSVLEGSPQTTPEGTFELYLRDAINQAARLQREKLAMRIGYEDREILEQDVGGLVVDVALIEDRSMLVTSDDDTAVYDAKVDVLVTFADGGTDEQMCSWSVSLEKQDDLWYVVSPSEMALFAVCVT